jgi:hypothetical protein
MTTRNTLEIQNVAVRLVAVLASNPFVALAARPGLWLILVCGLGFGLRFLLLDRESFWLDEAFSWGYAKLSLGRLWWEPVDVHPPVYYSLLHVLLKFGDSPWLLRMPSAAGGALAVPLVYLLARRVAGEWVGIGAALLLATSAIEIRYSQEARSYALLTSAALIVAHGFVGLFARPNQERRVIIVWSACYCAGSILALYLHYISMLLVGATFMLGTLAVARERSMLLLKTWAVANALILLFWLWWLPVIVSQLREGTPQFTLAPPGLGDIARGVRSLYGESYVYWNWQGGPTFEALLMAVGLFGAWVSARRESVVGLLLAAAAFGIPVLEIGLSWTVKPVFAARTISWLIPFYLLLVTIGLMRLPRTIGIAGFVIALAMQVLGTVTYFMMEENTPWSRLAAQLRAGVCPGDVLLVAPGYLQLPFDYATRNHTLPVDVFDIGVSRGNALMRGITVDETFARIRAAIVTRPPIWVLAARDYVGPWFNAGVAPFLGGYDLVDRREFGDVTLSHYAAHDQAITPSCGPGTTGQGSHRVRNEPLPISGDSSRSPG